MNRIYLLIFITFLSYTHIFAQYDNNSRAEYVFDISKYVKWQNDAEIDTFRIFVISKDSALYRSFKLIKQEKQHIQNRPVQLHFINNTEYLQAGEIVYVNHNEGYDIGSILLKTHNKNCLLISENYPYHKSMVNFIFFEGRKHFEINEARFTAEGFTASRLFMNVAVKNQADWEKLYIETETELEQEKEIVKQQEALIEKQVETIKLQTTKIQEQQNTINSQEEQIRLYSNKLTELILDISIKEERLMQTTVSLQNKELELQNSIAEINEQKGVLNKLSKNVAQQIDLIKKQNDKISIQLEQIQSQKLILVLSLLIVFILLVLSYFIYKAYRIKRKSNIELKELNEEILDRNEEILQQQEEIIAQRDEIEEQRDLILQHQKEMTDSIKYASRIQQAVEPPLTAVAELFPDYFILNKPRDIVSGDFYWISKYNNYKYATVADCTGHGVPGAFMSMLGITFLNDIMENKVNPTPAEILEQQRTEIINALNQAGNLEETKDGMDMSLIRIDENNLELTYAGAYNPLYIVRKGELIEFKATRTPIGKSIKEMRFSNHTFQLQKGDSLYMFSDGYADQFGGPNIKKFRAKNFKNLLMEIDNLTSPQKMVKLEETIENWRGNYEQIDDILVFGIKV